jgi:hypothetical protein
LIRETQIEWVNDAGIDYNDKYEISKKGHEVTKDNCCKFLLQLAKHVVTKNFLHIGDKESNKSMKMRYDALFAGFDNRLRTVLANAKISVDDLESMITITKLDEELLKEFANNIIVEIRGINILTEAERKKKVEELKKLLYDIITWNLKPTAVEHSGDTGVEPSGDTGVEPSGDTGVEPSGDTGVEHSGDTGVEPVMTQYERQLRDTRSEIERINDLLTQGLIRRMQAGKSSKSSKSNSKSAEPYDTEVSHYTFITRLLQFWSALKHYNKTIKYRLSYWFGKDSNGKEFNNKLLMHASTCHNILDFYGFPDNVVSYDDKKRFLFNKLHKTIFLPFGMYDK